MNNFATDLKDFYRLEKIELDLLEIIGENLRKKIKLAHKADCRCKLLKIY
jgi:hypothetical protein